MEGRKRNKNVMGWRYVDRMDTIWWGVSFIWGALVLLAGVIDFGSEYTWWNGWGVFFTGIGIITLVITGIRWQLIKYRYRLLSGFIWATLFLAVGLGAWLNAGWFWVIAILIAGILILRAAFVRNGLEKKSKSSVGESATDEGTDEVTRSCKMNFCPMSKNCPMTFCPMNEEVV
ncbi:MAG: hypothetical protein JSU58_05980 [Dehalococcoidales bacterium]|nr:MAG: hypothetical protein JSU58_05980 [Dehalococcoidales bacterium]